MSAAPRFWYVGDLEPARVAIASALGVPIEAGVPADPANGDTLFVEASPNRVAPGLPGGNAFSACRTWKRRHGVRVFMLPRHDDASAAEIARFCNADGCISLQPDGTPVDLESLQSRLGPRRTRASMDELLVHYEQKLGEDPKKRAAGFERMLNAPRGDSVLALLTDPETGLYDGPFASFKLDEELKRAIRFQQPLTLILLDIGVAESALPQERAKRALVLAEIASVFLNHCRDIDVLARFTPTTFLFLLPGTGHDGGMVLTRRMIDNLRLKSPIHGLAIDPRAGLVTAPAPAIDHREAFLMRAEACLERAQEAAGGSGVCASLE